MKFTPTPLDIKDLILQAEDGRLGLPEFQRVYRWKPKDVVDLLRTVARDWPAGSFLLLEGPQEFASKPIESAPAHRKKPSLLILDGQQRMTALYQTLQDHGSEVYYVDMAAMLEGETFDDEHLKYEQKSRFAKRFSSIERMAAEKLIPVHLLSDDKEFLRWTRYLGGEQLQEQAFAVRDSQLSGFKSYYMPCVVLPRDTPLPALAKIFETINRTGLRLDVFDLMVAKLYPHEFHLRDKWIEARDANPVLKDFKVDGIEILKLIALGEHLRQKERGEKLKVKGVRESDVLSLDLDVVLSKWGMAVSSYAGALHFVMERCGVASVTLLPSTTMMLPIADALMGEIREGFGSDLERWFWCSTFSQTYAQGSNTQAVADARALRAWRAHDEAVPSSVSGFVLDQVALQDERRRNEILVAGIGCLLVKHNARDWLRPGDVLGAKDVPLELHHVYPKKYLANIGVEDSDLVANLTVVTATTNQSLRNDSPESVAQREDVMQSAVESHALSWERFRSGDWNDFVEDRARRLSALIKDLTT